MYIIINNVKPSDQSEEQQEMKNVNHEYQKCIINIKRCNSSFFRFFLLCSMIRLLSSLVYALGRNEDSYFSFFFLGTINMRINFPQSTSCWTFSQFSSFSSFSYLLCVFVLTAVSCVYFCNAPDHVQDDTLYIAYIMYQ